MSFLNNNYYLVPLLFALTSFVSTFATIFALFLPNKGFLIKRLPSLFKHLSNSEPLQPQKLEQKISPLLDEKVSDLLTNITSQIPMGSMLLSGSLGKTLKEKAKAGIVDMLPELKEKGLAKGEEWVIEFWNQRGFILLLKYGTLVALFSGVVAGICGFIFMMTVP
jgi:hypothetical protein